MQKFQKKEEQDGLWNYNNMTSLLNTGLEKVMQMQMLYQELNIKRPTIQTEQHNGQPRI